MAGYFHLSIITNATATTEQLEVELNKLKDWIRYRQGVYIIYTELSPNTLFERLQSFVKPEGQMFVAGLKIGERQGWMTTNFWNWLQKNRERPGE
jgi:hypothetical protein